jgi:hypothetical protein
MPSLAQPILVQEILNDDPYAYWPCIDTTGATQASNYAAGNTNPLISQIGKTGANGGTYSFGQNSSALLGAQGTYLLTSSVRASASAGMWEQSGLTNVGGGGPVTVPGGYSLICTDPNWPSPGGGGVTVECWFQMISPTQQNCPGLPIISGSNQQEVVWSVQCDTFTAGGPLYILDSTGGIISTLDISFAPSSSGSALVHLALVFTATSVTGYLNGGEAVSPTAWVTKNFQTIAVNGIQSPAVAYLPNCWNGYVGHVAVWSGLLSEMRILTHYEAGLTGLTGDTTYGRVERLCQAGGFGNRRLILQDTGDMAITRTVSCQDISGQPSTASISATSTPPER